MAESMKRFSLTVRQIALLVLLLACMSMSARAQGPMCAVSGTITDVGNTVAPKGTVVTITPLNVPGHAVITTPIRATVGDNGAISFSVFKGAQVRISAPIPGYATPGRTVQVPADQDTYDFQALIQVPLQPLAAGNPMTEPGDLIVGGTNGAPQRAAKGAINTVFGVDANGVVGYKPDPAGGGGAAMTLREVDGSPSITGTTTFEFNQAAGFVLTDQGSHVTRLGLSGVPYSALNLAGGVVNGDVSGSAAIAQSKIANLTSDLAGKSPVGHSHVLADITNAGTAAAKNAPASGNAAAGEVVLGNDSRLTDARTPTGHAGSHRHGGSDEIATATPAANAIPKAGAGGTIAAGWIPDLSATYEAANSNIQSHIASTSNPHAVTKAQVGLGSVTNDAQAKATYYPNTAPAAGQLPVGNAGGTAYAPQSVGGDGSLASDGSLTVTKTSGVSFAPSATTDTTTTANIADSTNKRFITDAQRTVLGNTSGTNTGDQTSVSGNAGTATALQNARSIYGNSFDGTANLTQIIASTYGGTGNGFTKFSGPTTSEKTFTLPNASASILTDNAAVTAAQGGTGQTSYTDGQLLIGNTATGGLTKSALTAGPNITITNGNGSITIAASGGGTAADPTASVGLTAVNGSASTFMRSDAAPALSQSIAPTWTGQHIWSLSNAAAAAIGPNGNTNPTLRVVTNVASAAAGLSITGNAAGSGVTLAAISSGSDESIILTPKGSGRTKTASPIQGTGSFLDLYSSSDNWLLRISSTAHNFFGGGQAVFNITSARVAVQPSMVYGFSGSSGDASAAIDAGLARNAAGVVEVNNGTAGNSGVLLLRGRTFANLPASPVAGMIATVTDSTTTTYGATISGGGSNKVLAWYDGTNWTVH